MAEAAHSKEEVALAEALFERLARHSGDIPTWNKTSWQLFCKTVRNSEKNKFKSAKKKIDYELPTFLDGFPEKFSYQGQDVETSDDSSYTIEIKTSLKLCRAYGSGQGCIKSAPDECKKLHCCRLFLLDKCMEGENRCKFDHGLKTEHNRRVLKLYRLTGISATRLGALLKVDARETKSIDQLKVSKPKVDARETKSIDQLKASKPKVCQLYNSRDGCSYSCTKPANASNPSVDAELSDVDSKLDGTQAITSPCPDMHVCRAFVTTGICKFERKCKYSHNIMEQQPQRVLKKHGINVNREPSEILEELRFMLRRQFNLRSDTCGMYNSREGCPDEDEPCRWMHICRHYLIGDCHYGNACRRSHNLLAPQPRSVLVRLCINVEQSAESLLDELRENCVTQN